jgi:hypothetical protein
MRFSPRKGQRKRAAREGRQPASHGFGALWEYIHSSAAAEESQPARSGRTTRAALASHPISRTKASSAGIAERIASSFVLLGALVCGLQSRSPGHRPLAAGVRSRGPGGHRSHPTLRLRGTRGRCFARAGASVYRIRSRRYYASLQDMPVPLSKQNFNAYGASTTPTLVVLNRAGKVAMYHPGTLSYDELRAAVEKASAR